jgi:hypothetical protein
MMGINETTDFFTDGYFHIEHPYADFTFKTGNPIICGGTLNLSVWDVKGKISIDGNKWHNIEDLDPKDTNFTEYYYQTMFNNYGWVYQDIHATLSDVIKQSVFKKMKIISISNGSKPNTQIFSCRDIPKMDREILTVLDKAKVELQKHFNISSVTLSEEQIMTINIIDETMPEVDLLEETISKVYQEKILDYEKKFNYILRGIGITRFTIGKIHKQTNK